MNQNSAGSLKESSSGPITINEQQSDEQNHGTLTKTDKKSSPLRDFAPEHLHGGNNNQISEFKALNESAYKPRFSVPQ